MRAGWLPVALAALSCSAPAPVAAPTAPTPTPTPAARPVPPRPIERTAPVMTGDWQIVLPATLPPDADENGWLPSGTRVRIALLGPTRQGIEEDRNDQLGARVTLMPPFAPDICRAAAAASACRNGQPVAPDRPIELDATVTVWNWGANDAAAPENELFVEAGAAKGAAFALVTAGTAEWTLWLKGRDAMLAQYLTTDSGGRSQAAEQRWVRAAP